MSLASLFKQAKEDSTAPYKIRGELLYHKSIRWLLLVPEQLRKQVFEESHSSPLARHLAFRSKEKTARMFYWPGMARDLHQWMKDYTICQKNTTKHHKSSLILLPVIGQLDHYQGQRRGTGTY